jgi:hypothetical protein
MIEPRPATLTHASGCHTAPSEPRGWHYRGHLDGSDRPILRTIPTSPIDRGTQLPLPPGATLEWAVIVANLVAFFLAMFFIGATSKKPWLRCAALAVALGGLGMFLGVLGESARSVLSVDNATTMPVRVTADGMSVEVPPMSMTELRVVGRAWTSPPRTPRCPPSRWSSSRSRSKTVLSVRWCAGSSATGATCTRCAAPTTSRWVSTHTDEPRASRENPRDDPSPHRTNGCRFRLIPTGIKRVGALHRIGETPIHV